MDFKDLTRFPMKLAVLCTLTSFLSISTFVSCSKVESGEIVTCQICQVEVSNSVKVLTVPFWDADDYRVNRREAYCNICANEQIPYTVTYICNNCNKPYKSVTLTAARKTEPRDQRKVEGYCSKTCEKFETAGKKFDEAIDATSRWLGDKLGRAAKGLVEGASEHVN